MLSETIAPRKKLHPDFIQEVKERADIVEVSQAYSILDTDQITH